MLCLEVKPWAHWKQWNWFWLTPLISRNLFHCAGLHYRWSLVSRTPFSFREMSLLLKKQLIWYFKSFRLHTESEKVYLNNRKRIHSSLHLEKILTKTIVELTFSAMPLVSHNRDSFTRWVTLSTVAGQNPLTKDALDTKLVLIWGSCMVKWWVMALESNDVVSIFDSSVDLGEVG